MDKFYVGLKGSSRLVFKAASDPTHESHGAQFNAVVGPFRTKRGAMFHAAFGRANPHIQHVNDAERIAKRYADEEADAPAHEGPDTHSLFR